jgi:hypothetical protein
MSYPAGETERIARCEDEDIECDNEHQNQVWHADKSVISCHSSSDRSKPT